LPDIIRTLRDAPRGRSDSPPGILPECPVIWRPVSATAAILIEIPVKLHDQDRACFSVSRFNSQVRSVISVIAIEVREIIAPVLDPASPNGKLKVLPGVHFMKHVN
jgi:hypothetical protein